MKEPFESRRMMSWVVADTTGGRDPELGSERMGSSMEKWNHFLYTYCGIFSPRCRSAP